MTDKLIGSQGDSDTATPPTRPVDDIDRMILGLLAGDARLSHRELARRVGMSPGAVSLRVDRLERDGIIRGYHAVVDPAPLGYRTKVLIGLQVAQGRTAVETVEDLLAIPEVRSVSLVTGQWDFVVELLVRDQAHLRRALIDDVWRLPVFRHSETMVVLEQVERDPSWLAATSGPLPGPPRHPGAGSTPR